MADFSEKRVMGSLWRGAAVLMLFAGLVYTPVETQAQGSPATPVKLSFQEPGTKEVKKCSGGGLLGAMNCVATRIEGIGEGFVGGAKASLSLNLTAELEVSPASGAYVVRIKGGSGSPAYEGDPKPETRSGVNADAAALASNLAGLLITLDAGQIEALNRDSTLALDITAHFSGLQKLALEGSQVLVTVEMTAPVCVFAERTDVPDFAEMVRQKRLETDRAAGRETSR